MSILKHPTQKKVQNLGIKLRQLGKKIVFTNGCFDLLHAGHVTYLKKARRLGDVLVVGLNSDASVRRLKGSNRPLNSLADRAMVLSGLASVNYVIAFSEGTPEKLIQTLRPHVLVKGADWKVSAIAGRKEVESWGGEVRTIPLVKGRSTTSVIEKIARIEREKLLK